MKVGYTAMSASFDGTGFSVAFAEGTPSTSRLGTIIGYARLEQRKSGRTCFATSDTRDGLYFEPVNPTGTPEKLQEDLISFLESIGFDTVMISSLTAHPASITAKATASEQSLNA